MTKPPPSEDEKKARRDAAVKAKEIAALQLIASHSQSMAKHALVVQAFGGYTVNFFAFVNAAIFTALTAYIATEVGQAALNEHPYVCIVAYILAILGLFLSLGLMASVTHYSRNKFNHYRQLIAGSESKDSELFKTISVVIVVLLINCTIFGAAFATGLVLTTRLPDKSVENIDPAKEKQAR